MTAPKKKVRSTGKPKTHHIAVNTTQHTRDQAYHDLVAKLGEQLSMEELDIHFTHMPARYWARVNTNIARRHLLMIHSFFASLHDHTSDGTAPIIRWQHSPKRGFTEVEICTWDRIGLMAHVAGAMAAVGLNIIRADIFTRADHVVLDLLQVCEAGNRHVTDVWTLEHMAKLLTSSLAATSHAKESKARYVPGCHVPPAHPPVVTFETKDEDAQTVLALEADDRVGLLYDVFTALADCNVNVAHAIVTTENGRAGDVFFLNDHEGCRIQDPNLLETIRATLLARLG